MQIPDDLSAWSGAAEALPNWFLFAVPLIGLGLLLTLVIGVAGIWTLLNHARRIEQLATRLNLLDSLQATLKTLNAQSKDLDLRRIEHVLLEIREGQRRLDETLLNTLEGARSRDIEVVAAPSSPVTLADRVVNRLVALGYERVQILTSGTEIAGGADEILVEARRYGALCKGRIQVRDGLITDVQLQPSYGSFP